MGWCFISAALNAAESIHFWPFVRRKNLFIVWISIVLFAARDIQQTNGEPNKSYQMKNLCKTSFLQMVYRKADGAVLSSQNEHNLDCTITFQTHSILQRFLVRFDTLHLDCNDHLYIYDGSHATGVPKMDVSCRNTNQSVGNILTQSNFLTLKYVTDSWGTDSHGFKLVITAIKNINHACKELSCLSSEFCISTDLMCDNINHCGDGSDESSHLCYVETKAFFGLELTWLVLLAVSAFLVLSACFVGIAIWFCRLRTSNRDENNLQLNNHQHHQYNNTTTNGSSKITTTTINRTNSDTITFSMSGNMQHPARLPAYSMQIIITVSIKMLMLTIHPLTCHMIIH